MSSTVSAVTTRRRALWVPVVTAFAVWAALAGVTANGTVWLAAHRLFPWMIAPLYHDLHVVRLGWQAVTAGGDPLADPGNPFNYPRFVLAAAQFGALHVPAGILGLALAGAFLASFVVVLASESIVPPGIVAVLVVAPPGLLMIERGNLDAIAFALVAVALIALRRRCPSAAAFAVATAALLIAAMLKLFPAAGLVVAAIVWPDRRRAWFLVALAIWLGWALLHAPEIGLVLRKTTRGLEPSYGLALVSSRWYVERVAPAVAPAAAHAWLAAALRFSMAAYLSGLVIAAMAGGWLGRRMAGMRPGAVIAFASGATIFAGTFALGANWAYRLVFLVLCVPGLWELRREPALKRWATAALVGIAVILFAPFHLSLAACLLVQAVTWATAWVLAVVLAALVAAQFRQRAAWPAA